MQGAFIQTIEALSTLGYIVMVSNQGRYFRLASYLASFTQKSIVIAMGIPALKVVIWVCLLSGSVLPFLQGRGPSIKYGLWKRSF